MGPSDVLLLCAQQVFGTPVYRNGEPPWPSEQITCPAPHDELIRAFQKAGFRVFETPAAVHVAPDWIFLRQPNDLYAHWDAISLTLKVLNWSGVPGSRTLSDAELSTIARTIERQARTPPVATPYRVGPDGKSVSEEVLLLVDAHPLADRRESVVALWGQNFGDRRLVYGELEEGEYRPLWDSPLFKSLGLRLGYDDVDGDGTTEIVLAGAFARDQVLVAVFDRKGHELTRQADCGIDSPGYDKDSGVCPVIGASVDFDDGKGGSKDLVVERWYSARGSDRDRGVRFRLVDGRYVPVGTQP